MNSIDIDVGGTFTDLVLNFGGKTLIKKVPTTPYDLSVCFSRVIEEGASALSLKMEELLPSIDMIRYSTTIAMNRLIERKGPRLGLITTAGHEDVVLIGRGAQWIDGTRVAERRNLAIQKKPEPLIPRGMSVCDLATLGISECGSRDAREGNYSGRVQGISHWLSAGGACGASGGQAG